MFDTLTCGLGSHQFVYTALEMGRNGSSSDEIIETLSKDFMRKNACYHIVDDLSAMVAGGRLSEEEAKLAMQARIKPVLRTNDEGHMRVLERIRTSKKAIQFCVDYLENANTDYPIIVASINNDDKLEYMINKIKEKCPETSI